MDGSTSIFHMQIQILVRIKSVVFGRMCFADLFSKSQEKSFKGSQMDLVALTMLVIKLLEFRCKQCYYIASCNKGKSVAGIYYSDYIILVFVLC